ncbi:MAG: HEPN domain-containing protein [Phycisphaerae bacterium]
MAAWSEISLNNWKAAQALRERYPRSSVSRAYYAAFSALTQAFADKRLSFPGKQSPRHRDIPGMVNQVFSSKARAGEIRRNIRALYAMRLNADYSAGRSTDAESAKEAIRSSVIILRACGVKL